MLSEKIDNAHNYSRVEKQRAALQEKLTEQQQQRDAAQIKQQMEEQLKQQRVAMQQKRMSEGQPKIISTTGSTLLTTVTGTSTTTAGLKGITTLAPNTLLKSGGAMTTLLSGGSIIKKITQVQPKTTTGMKNLLDSNYIKSFYMLKEFSNWYLYSVRAFIFDMPILFYINIEEPNIGHLGLFSCHNICWC